MFNHIDLMILLLLFVIYTF